MGFRSRTTVSPEVAGIGRVRRSGIDGPAMLETAMDQPRPTAALGHEPIRIIGRDELKVKLDRGGHFKLIMALNRRRTARLGGRRPAARRRVHRVMTNPGSSPDVAPAGHPYRVAIDAERQGWHELVGLVGSLTAAECLVPGRAVGRPLLFVSAGCT